MKRTLWVAASAIAFSTMQPAFAADLPVKAPIVAPIVAPVYNWSGCYLGGFIGGATHARSWSSTDIGSVGQGGTFALYNGVGTNPWDHGRASSFIGGGTAGCNWQPVGSAFVLGIEGEIGSMRISASALEPNSIDVNGASRLGDWYGVIAGRAGWAVDRVLFYVKGGVAFYETAATVIDLGNTVPGFTDTVTAAGKRSQTVWTAGGGIEYALAGNWTIKGEYLYLGRGNAFNACGIDANVAQNFCWRQDPPGVHTAKFGFNYKFDWGGQVARY